MPDFVYNIALGRVAELYNRVDSNDPANSVLVIVVIDANGVTDATLRDLDTLSAITGTAANEVDQTGYARITLDDTDLTAFAADDVNDRVDLDIPDQTWNSVANDGAEAWQDVLICYDSDSTSGTDANIVPLTQHDFAVTPDGSNITMQVAAAGFYRAS